MGWLTWWRRWRLGEVRGECKPIWQRHFGQATVHDVLRFSVWEIASSKQGRSVGKLVVQDGNEKLVIFLKRHYRLPWGPRIMAWLWPGKSSAMQEWCNLHWALSEGFCVPEPLAVGELVGPGLKLQSFLAVRELVDMIPLHRAIPLAYQSLSYTDFQAWKTQLLQELGRIVRRLHHLRRFHKDLYLCHFYVSIHDLRGDANLFQRVYLIDLHRLREHRYLLWRWRTKDLAQLYFSMSVPGLVAEDFGTFFRAYVGRETLGGADQRLLRRVVRKAERYRRQNARQVARQPKPYWPSTPVGTNAWKSMSPAGARDTHSNVSTRAWTEPAATSHTVHSPDAGLDYRIWNRKPLRIALCYDKVYPARGGMEVFIVDLIKRLIRDGHEVHLFGWQRDAQALPSALRFHCLPQRWMPRFLRPWYFAYVCEEALRQHQFDVTVGFIKTWGQDVLLLGGGLHVANARYNLLKYRNAWSRWAARVWRWSDICYWSYLLLEHKQLCRGHRPIIIAVSHMVGQHCQEYYRIPSERIRVIHAAIDPERFHPEQRSVLRQQLRSCLGIRDEESVALFVGHNYALKGLVPLLHAMQTLQGKPLHLLVCGSRKDEPYRKLARRLGVHSRVHFLGYQSEVRRCFFAADFMVHPTFYDPCSLVVLEALACGLPVITTRYNGAAELLRPPLDGFIIDDPHDYWRLAEYLDLLCQPEIRQRCSQQALVSAQRWTFEHLYQALLDVFYEVARRKRLRQESPSSSKASLVVTAA